MSPEAIRALVAAGVSAEQLASAILAEAEAVERGKAAKRAKDAERKRNSRASVRDVTRTGAESGGHTVTPADPLQDKESPPDPQRKPNYPAESLSTREDEPTADKLAKVAVLRQAFAAFWAEYPRKKAKPDAERAYAKALAKPGVTPAVILDGLRRHLGGWATGDPEFVPHPATWLNREGWNDEADQPRQPRLIHDGTIPHHDRRAAAYRDRVQDVGDAADAAARAWHAERGH